MTTLTAEPGYRYQYVVAREAWWSDAVRHVNPDPEIYVTKAADDGGAPWEFRIADRTDVQGHPAIQVRIYDEAFPAFVELAPLFQAFAAEQPTTLDGARDILDRFGLVDVTERQRVNQ